MLEITAQQLFNYLRSPDLGLITYRRPGCSVEIFCGHGGPQDRASDPEFPVNVRFGSEATILFDAGIARLDVAHPLDADRLDDDDDVYTFQRLHAHARNFAQVEKLVDIFLSSLELLSEMRFEERFSRNKAAVDMTARVGVYSYGRQHGDLTAQQIDLTQYALERNWEGIHYVDATGTSRFGIAELLSDLGKGMLGGIVLPNLQVLDGAGSNADQWWRMLAAAGDPKLTFDVLDRPEFPSPFEDIDAFMIAVREARPEE